MAGLFTRRLFTIKTKVKYPKIKSMILSRKGFFTNGFTRFLSSLQDGVKYDVIVVGGGIVGMASAREISNRHKNLKMAVVEKESKLAVHQSGHNSGVIHAGIYYLPGSLKAKLCVEGLQLAYKYCDENNIPYKKCGKLIVATNAEELGRLQDLFVRGTKNNVPDIKIIEKDGIKEIEPHCEGLRAIHSPHTGIVNWAQVTQQFGVDFEKNGGVVYFNFEVDSFKESPDHADFPVIVTSKDKRLYAKYVLTCAGLYSDRVSVLSGCGREPQIIPFRGEYLLLTPKKTGLINGNIYPTPDPRFPFLGVHFTPRIDGSVWLGPNAVPCLRREGYTWTDINLPELFEMVKYPGFQKLCLKYVFYGMTEVFKSASLSAQVKDLRKFMPTLQVEDVTRGPAGVRAQALDVNGNLVDDFVFDIGKDGIAARVLHCRNAPSPGATSSLAIAKLVADKFDKQFQL